MAKLLHSPPLRLIGALALAMTFGVSTAMVRAQQTAPAPPPARIDAQARQILDRVLQALGGQAFLNARSLTSRGRAFFFQDGNTAGMEPFVSQVVYPDKRRFTYGRNKEDAFHGYWKHLLWR